MGPAPAAYEQLELDNHESSIRTTFSGSGFENVQDVSIRKHTYVATVRLLSYFLIFCATSLLILSLIELVMIYRTSSSNGESIMSIASFKLFSGSCNSDLHNYAIGIHFVINLVGTLVLASSNYLQHICSSPDYSEIIRQMQERGDISFGANSFLSVIRQKSTSLKVLWFSLLLSSLPLHTMLNGILGYAVHPVSSVRGTAGVQINGTDLVNATEISAVECVSYLLSSTAYVTDYDAMFVVLQPDAENSSTEYNGFAGAQGQWYPNFTPKSGA
jgi:hypothetical protein